MKEKISKKLALELYRKMRLCRRFEEKVIELVNNNEIYGTTHEYIGEEAVGVGICSALDGKDFISSTHRGHGHIISKGGDIKYMFAELFGKENGYNRGKGGSMHISEPALGILGANGIVGAGVPIAVGAALAMKLRKKSHIVVTFYGDGAANQGVVHEAMNMAAIWNLPIIFVCENNQYAVSTSVKYSSKISNLSKRAESYGFSGITIDGMDVLKVYSTAVELIGKVRTGCGPFLLECKTYRFQGHFTAESILGLNYRSEEEINYYKSKCPIKSWKERIIKEYNFSTQKIEDIDNSIEKVIEDAVIFARKSKIPDKKEALKDMYSTVYKGIPQKGWI